MPPAPLDTPAAHQLLHLVAATGQSSSSSPQELQVSGYIAELLHLFGIGSGTAEHVQDLLLPLVTVVIVIVVTALVAGIGARAIRRTMSAVARARAALHGGGRPAPRIETVSRIVANIWRVIVWVTGVLVLLGKLGIDLAPFLFGATVVGMTIGFGAQTVVRDFLAGFLLLLEDQYRIGDTITAVDTTGVVDEVTLRVTRLRASDGTIWYVPNGDIRELANLSRQWDKTGVEILLPVGADLDAATAAVEDELRSAYEDDSLRRRCVEAPSLLGVTGVDETGTTIEVSVKTLPLQGAAVARDVRARLVRRLTDDGFLAPPTAG